MHGGWDSEMQTALEADAAKLEAMGAHPGLTIYDIDPPRCEHDEFECHNVYDKNGEFIGICKGWI